MSRVFNDAENFRKDSDRYFQIPQWMCRPERFKDLGGTELKLLVFLISKQDKHTHCVLYRLSPSEVANAIGFNRNRVSQAFTNLALDGFIAMKRERSGKGKQAGRFLVQVLFKDPDLTTAPLKAERLNRESPSEKCNQILPRQQANLAEIARKDGLLLDDPLWVTDPNHDLEEVGV